MFVMERIINDRVPSFIFPELFLKN